MTAKKTIKGPKGYSVVLDKGEVYLDDPGQGTPALLRDAAGNSSTFWCALNEGEIDTALGAKPVPSLVTEWMCDIESEVNSFLYGE